MLNPKIITYILISLSILFLSLIFIRQGPSWDLIAHYFNAKTEINPLFYNKNYSIQRDTNGTVASTNLYFESFRSPFSGFIISLLLFANSNPLFLYIILLLILLIIAIYIFSKNFKIEYIITYLMVLNPYFLYFSFWFNSTEALSIVFLILAIAFLVKEKEISGLFLGIASISKYPVGIFLPMILLLKKPRKILYAFVLEIIPIGIWMAYNFFMFGNPIFSYLQSFNTALAGAPNVPIYLQSIINILIFPFIYFAITIIIIVSSKFKKHKNINFKEYYAFIKKILKSKEFQILASFLILAIIEFIFVGRHYDVFVQSRFGYLLDVAFALLLAFFISITIKKIPNMIILIGIIAILISIYSIYIYYNYYSGGFSYYYNVINPENVFISAKIAMINEGYDNCSFISNAWIYMMYVNTKAFEPFYTNNSDIKYPMLIFRNVGVNATYVQGLNKSHIVYNSTDFYISVPSNYVCVK
jgi:hypothetical protein